MDGAAQRHGLPRLAAAGAGLGTGSYPNPAPLPKAEFGTLFRELRQALQLPMQNVAALLNTRPEVIAALEMSDVMRLPPWPETVRIVSHYTQLAGIDPAPVLAVIGREVQAHAAALAARHQGVARREGPVRRESAAALAGKAGYSVDGFEAGDDRGDVDGDGRDVSWAKSLARRIGAGVSMPLGWLAAGRDRLGLDGKRMSTIAALCLVMFGAFAQGSALQASLATLNPRIANLMRSAQDYFLTRAAPIREGLKWIEVKDPRSRRTDRLQPGRL